MGFFRKKEKQYTLREAMEMLQKEEYAFHMPVPTHPGNPNTKYWLREENTVRKELIKTNPILATRREASPFERKRKEFMNEVSDNGNFKTLSHDIHESSSTKPGRVVPTYNNYQSAKNYQKKYGQSR